MNNSWLQPRRDLLSSLVVPSLLFAFAFAFVPLRQLNYLNLMPGDIGDARLNNYFLENVYLYLRSSSPSLWNLGFFYPFPLVIGFSDNLFGSVLPYIAARFLTAPPDTAFQIWFLFGYVANFASAFYALRRIGGSVVASSIGALIFTFALPTTAHAGHAQLHYRFGIPLSVAYFTIFLDKKNYSALLVASFWLVWQLYCTIYMGFFAIIFLTLLFVAHLAFNKIYHRKTLVFVVD